MNKQIFGMIVLAVMTCTQCTNNNTPKSDNPFLSNYTTPFEVPPFDKIEKSHYMPAFEEGMKQQKAEIEAIVSNKETATFENTVLAYDKSGQLLSKVSAVFFNLIESDSDDEMQEIARQLSPIMSKHNDDISMNAALFERISTVYNKRNEMNLDAQQIRVTEKRYNDFIRGGAGLSAEKQNELRQVNERLSQLSLQFGENLLAENANFTLVVDNEKDLSGLPQSSIAAAAETAKAKGMEGKWVFTLSKPSLIPFLQYADNRDLREKLYRGYFMRANNDNANDNKATIAEIVQLRNQKANLLGYENFAAFVLEENMAKNSDNVDKFLEELYIPALEVAKKELKEMQDIAQKEGAKFKLESWDWWYYAEKLRKEKYDLDENEIRPYFVLENVRDGMFAVANKLYGITFTKRTDLPIYHEQVEIFEVKEADGSHVGILYLDYYPRESKSGGAWCTGFREAGCDINGNRINPVVSLVCNFTPPTASTPALLTWDEVTTLFHEFGHGLHGLFTKGKYTRTAGIVPRDYVELPSQVLENWAGEPEVLKMYAKHYQTGEIIPESLINKLQNSSLFNQGFETVEYLAASILDMDYHKLTSDDKIEVAVFEKKSMDNIGLIKEILPRYRSTYFSHIFSGGYATGYYVYYWAAVLDADAFDYFKQSGDLFNPELAASFRKNCLAECGDDEGMVQYIKFRGQEPSADPLLKKKGLK